MKKGHVKVKNLDGERKEKSKIIAVMNNKGGCGKTTTSMALGMYFARTGNNVLFWDNDPQCNLTQRLGLDDSVHLDKRLHILFQAPSLRDNLDLLGRYPHLQRIPGSDKKPGRISIMSGSHWSETYANTLMKTLKQGQHNIGTRDIYVYFKDRINYFRNFYDYIVIDTAPAIEGNILNLLTVSVADDIIFPIDGIEGALGMRGILSWLDITVKYREQKPNVLFAMVKYQLDTKNVSIDVVPTDASKRMRNTVYRAMKEIYGDFVCDRGVRERRKLRYAIAGFGGKTEYTELCKEISQKLNTPNRRNIFEFISENGGLHRLDGLLADIEKKIRKRRPTFKIPVYEPINNYKDVEIESCDITPGSIKDDTGEIKDPHIHPAFYCLKCNVELLGDVDEPCPNCGAINEDLVYKEYTKKPSERKKESIISPPGGK